MNRNLRLSFLMLVGLVICCKDKATNPPPSPNPNFVFGEFLGKTFFIADTIDLFFRNSAGGGYAYVTFQALDTTMDSYEWTIGNDPRKFLMQSRTLYFNEPEEIRIKLKVIKNGKSDSLFKQLVVRSIRRPKLAGVWEGTFNDNQDSIVRFYILNGQIGSDFRGFIDTTLGWPTGERGFEYIFSGLTKIGFGSDPNSLAYSQIGCVTNGGKVTDNGFVDQFNFFAKDLVFSLRKNNELKVEMHIRRSRNDLSWVRKEFNGKKIE